MDRGSIRWSSLLCDRVPSRHHHKAPPDKLEILCGLHDRFLRPMPLWKVKRGKEAIYQHMEWQHNQEELIIYQNAHISFNLEPETH